MTDPQIRPPQAADAEALSSLARDIWHAHYPGIISSAQIEFMLAQRYPPQAIRERIAEWDVAWRDGKPIGFAHSFAADTHGAWNLDKLYVHPHHQRQGVGRALLNAVRNRALAAGARWMTLRVYRQNHSALAAYAQYGFRMTGEHVLDIGQSFVMDDYLMELTLE